MRDYRLLHLLLLLPLLGCFSSRDPADSATRPRVNPARIDRSALCRELADYIERGRIATTDDLARVLQLLSDDGVWTAADSAAVDSALPRLLAAKRALTQDDASKLRGLP